MKDRKEYYKAYNSKCKFINLRFNLDNETDKELYDRLCEITTVCSKSVFLKFLLLSYFSMEITND